MLSNFSVLNVKLNDEWLPVPAIRGTSVYIKSETIHSAGEPGFDNGGYTIELYDEKTKNTYELNIANGINGSGSVQTVDGKGVALGSTNIVLGAITYLKEQHLDPSAQAIARTNINAQLAGDYVVSPSSKLVNQFIMFNGNDWVAQYAIPTNHISGQILGADASNNINWVSAISTSEINALFD